MTRTSQEWWDATKHNHQALVKWLKDQYHGERMAAVRIDQAFKGFELSILRRSLVTRVAREEAVHARWIGELLYNRGVEPAILDKEERYWSAVGVDMSTAEDVAAIAHHAETMRLERIRAIVEDPHTADDIRAVFKRILPMEVKHAKWFEFLTTPQHLAKHLDNHKAGRQALGLVV